MPVQEDLRPACTHEQPGQGGLGEPRAELGLQKPLASPPGPSHSSSSSSSAALHIPSAVPANTPDTDGDNGLRVKHHPLLWIQQLQHLVFQHQEHRLALEEAADGGCYSPAPPRPPHHPPLHAGSRELIPGLSSDRLCSGLAYKPVNRNFCVSMFWLFPKRDLVSLENNN